MHTNCNDIDIDVSNMANMAYTQRATQCSKTKCNHNKL